MQPLLVTFLMAQALAPATTPPVTSAVSEAHAKIIIKLGIAAASLTYSYLLQSLLCIPEVSQSKACLLANEGVRSDRATLQGLEDPKVNPGTFNACEALLFAEVQHYSEDRFLAAGLAGAGAQDPALAAALAKNRNQLQVEAGPDPKLLASCRAVPGSWFAATWDGVLKGG